MEITKQDFENAVSVAKSAQLQIFDKIKPTIDDCLLKCKMQILGDTVMAALDEGKEKDLAHHVKRYVCIDAFLSEMRKLDLVLTPTGFGVVANNTTSPASKARVDALEVSLGRDKYCSYGIMLHLLRKINGWGTTEQAKNNIKTTFYSVFFVSMSPQKKDFEQYEKMIPLISEQDAAIRKIIGNEQMEDIMQYVRSNNKNVEYCDVCNIINEIFRLKYWNSPVYDDKVRYLLKYMESEPETFKIYMASDEYKANHYEPYQNKKDSGAYFFG